MTISNVVSKEWRQNASLKRISRADCPRPPAKGMMSSIRRILAFRAAAFFFALPARAADRILQLQNPPPVA
jgi:hypothetical protein